MAVIRRPLALFALLLAAGIAGTVWYFQSNSAIAARIATTSPQIAITNLNSQIASAEKIVAKAPERIEFRKQLFKLLATRAQFLGTFADFDRMAELTTSAPSSIDEYLLRIKFLTTIHDFSEAERLLLAGEKVYAESDELKRLWIPIKLARRENLSEVRSKALTELNKTRSYGNLVMMAGIESELGNFDIADQLFSEAITNYNDASPMPIAYLLFQRGVMWSEKAGDAVRGRKLYMEAVHYLPQFVVAEVHLAEAERSIGDSSGAIERLKIISETQDPEPSGLMGELLTEAGRKSEANIHLTLARTRYNDLLQKYPFAFADHGAEFFSGPGADAERALKLAKLNLSNRKSERAYIVAIGAAEAANSRSELCALIAETRSLNPVFPTLRTEIERLSSKCS